MVMGEGVFLFVLTDEFLGFAFLRCVKRTVITCLLGTIVLVGRISWTLKSESL